MQVTAASHRCAIERIGSSTRTRTPKIGARAGTVLVVAAHPDDETIGVGATLGDLVTLGYRVEVLHATDGAPRAAALRPKLRDRSVEEAAAIRRAEVASALRAGGLDPDVVLRASLGVPDQEATFAIPRIARAIARRLEGAQTDVIVTHPYEGGHPDHDAVALAVHASLRLSARSFGREPPLVAEMSSYHAAEGRIVTASFIASSETSCRARHDGHLDEIARTRKKRMLAAFATQADVLAMFGTDAEPLRCAPRYDFLRAPHLGALHYERLAFGWTGERWRALAREALRELGLT